MDGSQFLSALLDLIGDTSNLGEDDSIDLAGLESGAHSRRRPLRDSLLLLPLGASITRFRYWVRRKKALIERTMRNGTILLMSVAAIGMVWVRV